MNSVTYLLHLICSGVSAYLAAYLIRDPLTRPNALAEAELAESGSVPYFQALSVRAAAEGDAWLAEKLASHAADEERHGRIFAHALKQHIGEKWEVPKRNVFYALYLKEYSPASLQPHTIDWSVFMGSMYILELDASKEIARMANVLPESDRLTANLKKGLSSIAKDEVRHAAYLYEAMQRRMSQNAVERTINKWRTRQVQAYVTMAMDVIQKEKRPAMAQDGALYSWV
jgi:rubrerythrin